MLAGERLVEALRYPDAGYGIHTPTPRQHAGLLLPHKEVLYGGAAGGGKSDWLLMAALQYVNVPGYAALLLRRTFPQLTKADSLIPRAAEWLMGSDADWSDKFSRWTFPSGATLEFGHLQYEKDKYNYQGAAYQYVGWDELTQFTKSQYTYLHSRTRRPKDANALLSRVPIRVRAGSNPGGMGHDWVKARFLTSTKTERAFLPAKLADNPYLDQTEYIESLNELDPVTRAQLLEGNWKVRPSGGLFKREWCDVVNEAPTDLQSVRAYDFAATEEKPGADPDWSVGARIGRDFNKHYFVGPLWRKRLSPNKLDKLVMSTAQMDGRSVAVRIEQEPGASGKIAIAHFQKLLSAFDARGRPATGSKLVRFGPFSSACEAGNVTFINGPWLEDCIDELESLQHDGQHAHDDQADAIALGYNELHKGRATWADATRLMGGEAA